MKKIISVFLSLFIFCSICLISGSAESTTTVSQLITGDTFEFGSYPQSKVTDESIISQLDSDDGEWVSYGYYSGNDQTDILESDSSMQSGDFMEYKDVTLDTVKYRGVRFSKYRPTYTNVRAPEYDIISEMMISSDSSNQDNSGYFVGTTYWFKYEPIIWRVLDPEQGLVFSMKLLDSQPFNNTIYLTEEVDDNGNKKYHLYQDETCKVYANNYPASSIRKWLNEDFYNTAFSGTEDAVTVSDLYNKNTERTNDNVFLIATKDYNHIPYGFCFYEMNESNRMEQHENEWVTNAEGTDYAFCQGLGAPKRENDGRPTWILRDTNYDNGGSYSDGAYVICNNWKVITRNVYATFTGVRPAVRLKTDTTVNIVDSQASERIEKYETSQHETQTGTTFAFKDLKARDTFEFGSYPQSKVTDDDLIARLSADGGEWKSYKYYEGTGKGGGDGIENGKMWQSDYMLCKDVAIDGALFRGVKFKAYRPYYTSYQAKTEFGSGYFDTPERITNQYDNGYFIDTEYWFAYEPVVWRVLDPAEGLVMSETILDSQAFTNEVFGVFVESSKPYIMYGDSECVYYANNYAESSIRKWLNEDFCNTAFSAEQQMMIEVTELENTGDKEEFDSASTNDKIFLLDLQTASVAMSQEGRVSSATDYAKSQGIQVDAETGNSSWRLRTTGSRSSANYNVDGTGYCDGYLSSAHYTGSGIRPAMRLNLSTDVYNMTEAPEEPVHDEGLRGDADGNGQVLANDARLVLRASAKLETLDEEAFRRCDLNGDGFLLAAEARLILRYSAKLEETI